MDTTIPSSVMPTTSALGLNKSDPFYVPPKKAYHPTNPLLSAQRRDGLLSSAPSTAPHRVPPPPGRAMRSHHNRVASTGLRGMHSRANSQTQRFEPLRMESHMQDGPRISGQINPAFPSRPRRPSASVPPPIDRKPLATGPSSMPQSESQSQMEPPAINPDTAVKKTESPKAVEESNVVIEKPTSPPPRPATSPSVLTSVPTTSSASVTQPDADQTEKLVLPSTPREEEMKPLNGHQSFPRRPESMPPRRQLERMPVAPIVPEVMRGRRPPPSRPPPPFSNGVSRPYGPGFPPPATSPRGRRHGSTASRRSMHSRAGSRTSRSDTADVENTDDQTAAKARNLAEGIFEQLSTDSSTPKVELTDFSTFVFEPVRIARVESVSDDDNQDASDDDSVYSQSLKIEGGASDPAIKSGIAQRRPSAPVIAGLITYPQDGEKRPGSPIQTINASLVDLEASLRGSNVIPKAEESWCMTLFMMFMKLVLAVMTFIGVCGIIGGWWYIYNRIYGHD